MTTITYKKTDKKLEIQAKGHSGYADAGSDIVCASISTAMEMTYDLLLKIREGSYNMRISPNETLMEIVIYSFGRTDKLIFDNLVNWFKRLEKEYPKYVKVEEAR